MKTAKMIVGLCGYARTGKDTAAEALVEKLGFTRLSFADALKSDIDSVVAAAGGARVWPLYDQVRTTDKEQIRPLWIAYGAFMRSLDPDHWVKRVIESDAFRLADRVVVSDVRYHNEIDALRQCGAHVLMVHRPGFTPANAEEMRSFKEIFAKDDLPEIVNVDIEMFRAGVVAYVEGLMEARSV